MHIQMCTPRRARMHIESQKRTPPPQPSLHTQRHQRHHRTHNATRANTAQAYAHTCASGSAVSPSKSGPATGSNARRGVQHRHQYSRTHAHHTCTCNLYSPTVRTHIRRHLAYLSLWQRCLALESDAVTGSNARRGVKHLHHSVIRIGCGQHHAGGLDATQLRRLQVSKHYHLKLQ